MKAAVDELKSQEDAFTAQLQVLEGKATDESASTVSKNKAAAELAQLKQENPMPLRKAKITQEAALRKVEKERKAVEAAIAALEEQKLKVEQAEKDIQDKVKEAEEFLEQVKKKGK